ncbi:DUF6519 domain-containing protein [Dactylosporangium sp. NPDC051541]|uniref:DUF6519 domain-containing protein n=1 Tax=Dactylosporangium sp. NPDC051541 TaxID=3363977 RepID=UPI0037B5B8A2
MGDFSRDTFDRVKHYVGVRLQQGVPLVDADWNEQEDIRRYEVQAFLKWFVGDGVPFNNDGFRIDPLAGGGVNTIRLTAPAAGAGRSSVTVDVAASSAAAALGFTNNNRRAARLSAAAQLTGDATQPFALSAGMTLKVTAEGGAAQTVTFAAASFANIAAATAAEVVAVLGGALTGVTASAGAGDDFMVFGGSGTAETAGRCLVDGRDAVLEDRLSYAAQPLYTNTALATAWGVPPVAALSAPSTGTRTDLVYLDVWEREVTAAEDDSLINPMIGVESAVRLRREWAVRVRPGSLQAPQPADGDFLTGHSYLPLAQLARTAGVTAILGGALADQRARSLLMPPSTLIEDVMGFGSLAAYRRGENRPAISLRVAINALLAGQLPASQELAVSPAAGLDTLGRASLIDQAGALVAIWHSPRVSATNTNGLNQIIAARLDPAHVDQGFTTVPAITGGNTVHIEPSAVLLPTGEILVAYQTGNVEAAGSDVVMKRGTLANLPGAAQQDVATTTGVADQLARVALAGDHAVFFTHQGGTAGPKQWFYKRYRHTDSTFIDALPVQLSTGAAISPRDLHAAGAGGKVFVAWADNTGLQLRRFNPIPATSNPLDPPVIDFPGSFTATGTLEIFVLAISDTAAMVFYNDGAGLSIASCTSSGNWTSTRLADTDAGDGQPAAVRDQDGTVYLVSSRPNDADPNLTLRRRNPISGQWGAPQRLTFNSASDIKPHPFIIPGLGLWVLWNSNRNGDFDPFYRRIITAI